MIDPLDNTSVAREETADLSTMSENVFQITSLPENTEDDDEPDTEFALEQQKIEGLFKISEVLVLMPPVESVSVESHFSPQESSDLERNTSPLQKTKEIVLF